MSLFKKRFILDTKMLERSMIGILVALAIALRISFYPAVSGDMFILNNWTDFIKSHGGFAALQHEFANYNMPYLYLLTIISYIPIPTMFSIKTISVIFDCLLAFFAYRIIHLRYPHSFAAIIGALTIFFAPTVFINSAAWGQCDSIYTAFCLGSLYFLLRDRAGLACTFFALAIAFKLQAIFFAPVLLILLLTKKVSLKSLLLVPSIFLVLLVPALLAGRGVGSLLTIYVGQAQGGGVGTTIIGPKGQQDQKSQQNQQDQKDQPGKIIIGPSPEGENAKPPSEGSTPGKQQTTVPQSILTLNAPSIYQWFPASASQPTSSVSHPDTWEWMGILLAGSTILFIAFLIVASRKPITIDILIKLALVLALVIPFLLPKMHERYFYLADVLSIIYVFAFPRRFYVAILVQLCSLLSYLPFLFNTPAVNLKYVAFGVLLAITITLTDLVLTLYPELLKRVELSDTPKDEAS